MSVTTTQFATNTVRISLSGEQTPANFITALDSAITGAGWVQVDVSNQYNRIYSCLNADGTTSKYIGINIDPGTLRINTTSYESWNATTHVGTNETWTFNRAGSMGLALSYCDVLLMISTRWCILQTFIRNQASCWSGVIELAREAPEDTVTAGYPCWVWMSSATAMTAISATTVVNSCCSFPRTVSGATGYNAAGPVSFQTPYTRFGATAQLGQAFSTATTYFSYQWTPANRIVHSLRPVVGLSEVHGRMFGLKMTYNIGSPYSQVTMPVDSNFAYSNTGTNTTHWILGAHPNLTMSTLLSATAGYPSGSVTTQSIAMPGSGRACEPVGYYYYVATSVGVNKIDGSSTTLTSLGIIAGTSGKDMWTIVYDNYQYVYAGGPDGVYRIDTLNNDNVTFLAITNGVSGLWWDGTYVWTGIRTAATTSHMCQITASSFTITGTVNFPASPSTIVASVCSDYAGNTYAICASATAPIYKIVNSSLTVTSLCTLGVSPVMAGIYFNGVQLIAAGWFNTTVTYKTFTLGGTVILSGSYVGGYNLSSNTNTLQMGKFGAWDYYTGCLQNYGNIFTTDMSGVVGNITFSSQTQLNGFYSFQTDNNRAFSTNGSTFYLYTNCFKPDDQSTAYGRFLLPA